MIEERVQSDKVTEPTEWLVKAVKMRLPQRSQGDTEEF
jgi:hypothetical protein